VHESQGPTFFSSSIFGHSSTTAVDEVTTRLSSLLLNSKIPTAPPKVEQPTGNHAFSIITKILRDSEFASKKMEKYSDGKIQVLLTERGDNIWRYAEQWTIDLSQPGEIERKIEECIWSTTILYAIGGWSKEKGFRADYFLYVVPVSSFYERKNTDVLDFQGCISSRRASSFQPRWLIYRKTRKLFYFGHTSRWFWHGGSLVAALGPTSKGSSALTHIILQMAKSHQKPTRSLTSFYPERRIRMSMW
jgi:hypothetical protein